jgi:molecular chaperone GrpE
MEKTKTDHLPAGPPKAETPPSTPQPVAAAVAAPETLTPAEIETLKAGAAKAEENWNRYVRAVADLENYKKRAARERHEAVKFANERLMQKLLSVLDHFEMAQVAAQNGQPQTLESLQAGLTLIRQQLNNVLAEAGLEEVDATGKAFDHNFHEAVSQQETADVPEGHVVQQLRKGYKLHDRLLRPASVVVAKKPASPPPAV